MRSVSVAALSKTTFLAIFTAICAGALIASPQTALEASTRGLSMWWHVVFPALLPFFIISELLIGFGVVSFIGILLEPLMRPLFRVPGIGGFVWAMGLASGNPAGAKLAVRMRQAGHVSRIEGERLAAFTNSANPLFIFGAIAVGFFHHPSLGLLLAIAHYGGNILVGLCYRFYRETAKTAHAQRTSPSSHRRLREALIYLHEARMQDGRTLGVLIGDAVRTSVQTLLMIGGFIILFSVLNELLTLIGLLSVVAMIVGGFFTIIGLHAELAEPLVAGLFEVTIGAQQISTLSAPPLVAKAIAVSFILGFGGLSIQAQVASILAESDLRFRPFFYARLLQGAFAALLAAILFQPLSAHHAVNAITSPSLGETTFGHIVWQLLNQYGASITFISLITFIFLTAYKVSSYSATN